MNAITNLSRLDLNNDENVKDMGFEFERCSHPVAFEAWARKWGAAIVDYSRNGAPPDGFVAEEDLKVTEASLKDAAAERDALQERIDQAITDIDEAMEGPVTKLESAMDKIVARLESAADEVSA